MPPTYLHRPETQQELIHLIRYQSTARAFWEERSHQLDPSGCLSRNLPGVFITCAHPSCSKHAQAARLQLLFIKLLLFIILFIYYYIIYKLFGCFRARVWQSPASAQHPSLPRQSHHLHSPLNQHCPLTRLSQRVCEVMAQKAQILPKASTALYE